MYLESDKLPKEPVHDILYDTTGSVDGFALALKLTNRSKSPEIYIVFSRLSVVSFAFEINEWWISIRCHSLHANGR